MNTQRSNRLGILALAGLVLLASQTAFSQEDVRAGDREVVRATIDTRDVDVTTVQGARWVFRRIVSTAQTVCFGGIRRNGRQWLSSQTAVARSCFDDSVTAAVAQVQRATGVDVERLAALDRYDTAVASN